MVEPEVLETVKAYLAAGKTEDEIAAALLNAGHGADEASEAISAAKSESPRPIVTPQAQPVQPAPQTAPQQAGSKGLNFGVLPRVLYQPRQAFEKIKEGTALGNGLIMFAILATISLVIMQLPTISKIGSSAVSILVTVVLGMIGLALMGAFSAVLAGAFGGKRNVPKTIGMVGYGQILGVVQAVVSVVLLMAAGITLASTGIGGIAAAAGVSVFFIIIFFVWGLWINGSAVAVANETTLVKGAIAYFVAVLVVSMAIGFVSALLLYSVAGGAPAVPTG